MGLKIVIPEKEDSMQNVKLVEDLFLDAKKKKEEDATNRADKEVRAGFNK